MKKAKRLFALIIAALMLATAVVALAACTDKVTTRDAAKSELEAYGAAKFAANDYTTEGRAQINSIIESGKKAIEEAETDADVAAALAAAKAEIDKVVGTAKQFTYTGAFSLSPSTWNPHQYKSTNDAVPLDYTTSGWYEFDYNADRTGFELVPVLAAADPEDVTAQYVGTKWATAGKIAEGATGRVFRIRLNRDAKWDNGDSITADDYIYSMQQVLSPDLINYRASGYYQGSAAIVGARNYFYSDRTVYVSATEVYETLASADKSKLIFSMAGGDEFGTVSDARAFWSKQFGDKNHQYGLSTVLQNLGQLGYDYMGLTYEDNPEEWVALVKQIMAFEGKTLEAIEANESDKEVFQSLLDWWIEESEDETLQFFLATQHFEEASWDDVGLLKIDDYTLDWICVGELEGFYIKYNLGNSFLVYEPLYEACKSKDQVTGVWSSSYGTSPDKYMGYGPYKMTNYIQDQIMEFEKSETWFGFSEKYAERYGTFEREIDGATVQQYQTSKVILRYVPEIATREQMFLNGELVGLGLDDDMFAKYRTSRSLYYSQGTTTFYGIISSDFENLQAREAVLNGVQNYNPDTYDGSKQQYNKTILTIKEFRQALALGLNREEVAQLMPGTTPGLSLFSDAIISDPLAGINLNSYDVMKASICEFWGVTWGPDGDFATLDAAYKAVTGYDPERAKQLVDIAVDKAIAAGLMGPNTIVRLEYGASQETPTEVKWYNSFKAQFERLMTGTKLEGKFQYDSNFTLGSEFGDRIRTGNVDTAWGFGWSGGALDPYGLFEVYVDATYNPDDGYQYDPWVDWSLVDVTLSLNVDGAGTKDYTYNVVQWFLILNGGATVWADDPHAGELAKGLPNWGSGKIAEELRVTILAELQKTVLSNYTTIPMSVDGGAQLKSYKINYGLESYNFFIGFGGIRFMTYNYSDVEWAAFVASQGGTLTY